MMKTWGAPARRNWLKGMCITGLRFVNRDVAWGYLHRMGWFRHSLMELAKKLSFDPLQSNLPVLSLQDYDDERRQKICREILAILSLIPGLVKDFGPRSFCLCDWWFVAVLVNTRFIRLSESMALTWYDIDAFNTLTNHIDLYERESRIHTSDLVLGKIMKVRTVRVFDLENRSLFREGGDGIFGDRECFRLKRLAALVAALRQAPSSSEAFRSRDALGHLFNYLKEFPVPVKLDRDGTRPTSYCPTTLLSNSTLRLTPIALHARPWEQLFQSHVGLAGGDGLVFRRWFHFFEGTDSCGKAGFPVHQVISCPDGSLEVFFQYPTKVALDQSFAYMTQRGDFMLAVRFPFGFLSWFDAYIEQYGYFRDQLNKYATVRLDRFSRVQLQDNKEDAQAYSHVVHSLIPLFMRIRAKFGEELICMSDRYRIYQWQEELLSLGDMSEMKSWGGGIQGGVSQAFFGFSNESNLVARTPQHRFVMELNSSAPVDAEEFFSRELDPARFDSSIHEHSQNGQFEGVLRQVIQVPNVDMFGGNCPGPFGDYPKQRGLYAVDDDSYSHPDQCAREDFIYMETFDKEVLRV
jgi:hypothetical protein